MKKLTSAILGATLFAGAAMASYAAPSERVPASSTYWWAHPRLGMVKVDRATNAIVPSPTRTVEPAKHAANSGSLAR